MDPMKRSFAMTMLMMQLLAGSSSYPKIKSHGPAREPWDRVNLPKAERKGKTYEELQEMRRKRYETKE